MENSKKVLILGSAGMLGQALVKEFLVAPDYRVTDWDREDIDLTNFLALEKAIGDLRPDIVINTAAYNAVDKCEESAEEYEKAVALNAELPEALANLSNEFRFLLVQYSTDYVFDGTRENDDNSSCESGVCCGGNCHGQDGYAEDALPNPISKYGETKLAGENAVRQNAKCFYLIRLSKLFGKPGTSAVAKKSFFDTMLEKGRQGGEIQVVDREKSCFTYAPDLAHATRELIEDEAASGIYHLPNSGGATWYEGARELFKLTGMNVRVAPVSPETLPRPARRPTFSVLANTKRPPLRPYQEALKAYIVNP